MKKRLHIYSLAAMIFIIATGVSEAGKIYRWTDSEGNVQFTSTPGPNQSADENQGQASKTTKHNDYDIEDILSGTWYGSSRTSGIELRFGKDNDFLTWASRPRGGGVNAENFNAKWKYVNSDLEIVYSNHKQQRDKNGTRAVIKIVDKSADSIILQFPDEKVYRLHKRIKRKAYSQSERKFNGKWELKDKKQTQWNFSNRGFIIKGIPYGQYNHQTLASGNWKVEGDILVLTHLNDRHIWDKTKKAGQIERFKILLQEQGKIILNGDGSGQQLVLHRKR